MSSCGLDSRSRPQPDAALEAGGDVPYYRFPALDVHGVAFHAFTTRLGGVSGAPYNSLNLGGTTRDDAASVQENRRRAERTFGHALEERIRLEHGKRVHVVEDGAAPQKLAVADGLITRLRGVPLLIYYADCVPVLLLDPETPALGVVHAGWRGTVAGAAEEAVLAMREAFGTRPQSLLAGLGSSIGPCCMQVGDDVTSAIRAAYPSWQESVIHPHNMGKSTIDLWELNCLQLTRAGVPRENVAVSALCTACRKDLFFSYRRDQGDTGRLAMLAALH
jgi:YfiH family protein